MRPDSKSFMRHYAAGRYTRGQLRAPLTQNPPRADKKTQRTPVLAAAVSLFVGFAAVLFAAGSALAFAELFTLNVNVVLPGGDQRVVQTTASTVAELIQEQELSLEEGQSVLPEPASMLREGQSVYILPAMGVWITSGEQLLQLELKSGTVMTALEKAGITPDENDIVTPALDTPLRDGIGIIHIDVEHKPVIKTTDFEYDRIVKKDDAVKKGETRVAQAGAKGTLTEFFDVVLWDGEEKERRLLHSIDIPPVPEIILEGIAESIEVPNERELKNDPRPDEAAPAPGEIVKTLTMEATAYTHTGRRTATGTRPRVGTVAVNPEQIPYGTRLYIEGYGYGIAEDTGAFRHYDRRQVDLFMDTYNECIDWGRRTIKVYVLG